MNQTNPVEPMNYPYLTANQPGIGGQLKVMPEDFVVEEIPLYLPCGEGQHVYVEIEKRGISTFGAIKDIARALKVPRQAIGYAGLKDAFAITRQTISINNMSEKAVEALDLPKVKILSVSRHRNKLKTGHLAGNRFIIRVREVTEESIPAAQMILDRLHKEGAPNYFGEQRFGHRDNTHRLGEMLIRGDFERFVTEYLGSPQAHERADVQASRQLIDEGLWAEALEQWPHQLSDEKRVLAAIAKNGLSAETVYKSIDKKMKGFFVSAYQSYLFNQLLAQRLPTITQLQQGDVAYIHGKGAAFLVEDPSAEQPRADTFDISPTGPLFGPKMLRAQGIPGEQEQEILQTYNLAPEDFNIEGVKVHGARRPYRLKIKNPRVWWDMGLMVSFELESGAYATTVMNEIMK
jgi:tRNA pseudouridine13 synthase